MFANVVVALLRVGERRVRLAHLLEGLRRARVPILVWVHHLGQLQVRLLRLGLRDRARDAEHVEEVERADHAVHGLRLRLRLANRALEGRSLVRLEEARRLCRHAQR